MDGVAPQPRLGELEGLLRTVGDERLKVQLQVEAVVGRRVEFPEVSPLDKGQIPEGEILLF